MQSTNDATHIGHYDMYEIRIGKRSRNYRILCTIKNECCWLLHLFLKKTQQLELREFKTALARKKYI
jgi:phage-related protein